MGSSTVNTADAELSAIYGEQVSFVCHCLRRLGVPDRDLEDKAQDVFVVVHRKLADYDRARPIRPWLTGIAARVALDHLRKAYRKHEDLREQIETAHQQRDPEQQLAERQARELVLAALDRLDLDQRAVFVLADIEGHSMPEIAEIIDAPLNTLYSRLRLARQRFTRVARTLSRAGAIR
ncbi:MAG: sigma-70 family RNA polymerase sigma factor [Myxococcales bacterium]|nr:sigma-70 family RNA polymerase sigma factor [Myxococcales bacterium]